MDSDKVAAAEEVPTSPSPLQNKDPEDNTEHLEVEVTETANIIVEPAVEDPKVSEEIEETKLTTETAGDTTFAETVAIIAKTVTPTASETSDFVETADTTNKAVSSATQKIDIVETEISDEILPSVTDNGSIIIAADIIDAATKADIIETNVKSAAIESQVDSTDRSDAILETTIITTASESKTEAVTNTIVLGETSKARTEINNTIIEIVTIGEIQEDPESEKSLSREVELIDYSDDSASVGGSDRGSGNECDSLTDSNSTDDNYRNARRTPPKQYGDDVTSTDGDNGAATGDDGIEEQVQDEEPQADTVEAKESPQPPRKVDDDEDKNNPQYIPKRGTFYEHDYRTTEDVADGEKADTEKEKADGGSDSKKKMWHDKRENWSHDKFKNDDQIPKSRDELIAIYGYDIRNEDGPPRARRRRRYGRGPNKYTRNWEDEDAYYKTSVKKPTQQAKGADQPHQLQEEEQQQQQQESSTRQIRDNLKPGPKFFRDQPQEREHAHVQDARSGHIRIQSAGTGRIIRPNRDYASSDYKSFTKTRNYNRIEQLPQQQQYPQRFRNEVGNNGGGEGPRQQRQHTSPGRRYHRQTQDNRDVSIKQLDTGMASLSLQQQQFDGDSNEQRATERKPVPKRYSAMRQRPFPDAKVVTLTEAFAAQQTLNAEIEQRERERIAVQQQQQHYYEQQPPPASQVNVAMCAPPQLNLPPRQINLPDPALAQQLAVAGRQIHPQQQQQQRFVSGVPALQPTPSQFISPPPPFLTRPPQQPPINLNYQLAPQHYYQHQQAPPPPQFVTQPMAAMQPQQVAAEQLFQPQGGITYYSPEEQQTTQRHVQPMRPKAAIPILPPPPTLPPITNNINLDI